ncbi:hypothetical protein N9C80_05020 [Paracoccaceae bacterium]|nr:hypothetical protein [Paracoccaceae bacterium]
MQRHLHKGFTLRSRQTQKLGLLEPSAQGGIAQPICQSLPSPSITSSIAGVSPARSPDSLEA